MKNYFLSAAVLLLAVVSIMAQTDPMNNWARLESDSKDLTIAVPTGYEVMTDKEGYETNKVISRYPFKTRTVEYDEIRKVTAYINGASFLIESYRVNKLDDALEEFYAKFKRGDVTDISVNSFQGKSSIQTNNVSYMVDVVLGSKDRLYRIIGLARSDKNEALKYFLSSIKLNGAPPFALGSVLEGKIREQPVSIRSLSDTPFEFQKGDKNTAPPANDQRIPVVMGVRPPEDPTRLYIAYKPVPRYTAAARGGRTTGKVSLRITFGANGQIEKIAEVYGLPHGLTEEAVKVARLMRFLPQEADGKPVAVERTIEYGFQVY